MKPAHEKADQVDLCHDLRADSVAMKVADLCLPYVWVSITQRAQSKPNDVYESNLTPRCN